jgi:hypothetical protein
MRNREIGRVVQDVTLSVFKATLLSKPLQATLEILSVKERRVLGPFPNSALQEKTLKPSFIGSESLLDTGIWNGRLSPE